MKKRKKKLRKLASIMLCIMLFATVYVVPGSTNIMADEPEEEPEFPPPIEEEPSPTEFEYSLCIENISTMQESDYPDIIFVNTLTYVEVTFINQGEEPLTDITVKVFEVILEYIEHEEGELELEPHNEIETEFATLYHEVLLPGEEIIDMFPWTPTYIDENTLRFNMSYTEASIITVYEEETTLGVVRDDLPIIEMNEDWIIDGNVTMDNVTIILEGDIIVNEEGNLTLQDGYLIAGNLDVWGVLFLRNFNLDLRCRWRGQYHVWVHKTAWRTGMLLLWGCTVYNNRPRNTYHFYVDGVLDCREWRFWYLWPRWFVSRPTIIMHVWGQDSGGSETGGIELRNTVPSEQSRFRYTTVKHCDTIGIGCYGSSPQIYPYCILENNGVIAGRTSPWGRGKGLYAEGSTANPTIKRSWIRWNTGRYNQGHGIRLRDSASGTIINNYIYRNRYAGVYCYYASSSALIKSNQWFWGGIHDNYYGVVCVYSSPTIEYNWIGRNRYGVYCSHSGATVKDNTIDNNWYGLNIYYTPSPTVDGNGIIANRYTGLYLRYSSPTIQSNVIDSNGYRIVDDYGGIYGYYSTPTIKLNAITNNDGWGIWMQYGAPTNGATIGFDNFYGPPENVRGRVWQQWWIKVKTVDADNSFVAGATVKLYDQKSWPNTIWTGTTGSTGYTSTITVTEYKISNGEVSRDFYTPHTVHAEMDLTSYKYTTTKTDGVHQNKVITVNFVFRRFAILFAPCRTSTEEQAFKGDISKMRDYLINKGWLDSNMWFLTSGSESYVDGDATYDNVVTALDDIADRSTDQDIVYIQYVDHGGSYRDAYGDDTNWGGRIDGSTGDPNPYDENDDSYCSIGGGGDSKDPSGNEYDGCLDTKGQRFFDDEFAAELNDIVYRFLVLANCACFSAEFIEDCSNDFTTIGRIINTAAPENDFAYWNPNIPPYYTFYAYYFHEGLTWTSALPTNNPDTSYPVSNSNGRIEIEEAHAYAVEYDTEDEPKIWDWKPSANLYLP